MFANDGFKIRGWDETGPGSDVLDVAFLPSVTIRCRDPYYEVGQQA